LKRIFILKSIIQFVLLMVVWLLLSGHYDFTHVFMGVISVAIVMALHWRLRKYYFFQEELKEAEAQRKGLVPVQLRFLRLLYYLPWLILQIVIASLQVAYVVLRPKMPIDPSIIKFKTNLPNASAKVILGNSITLTPGTITVGLDDDEFIVHAIMDASSSGILDGSLPGEVAKLYEKKTGEVVRDVKIIKRGAEL
jgi:multicomponent Na+:H+ antiporter subunit E